MIQINKTDLKTAIQWALGSIGIWTPEIERELIIEITNLALSQHDVIKNEVAVCDNHRPDLEYFMKYSESICKNCKQKV